MNIIELIKLAMKELNTKNVQNIKKQLCKQFICRKQKKDCITEFDKSFIKSFIISYRIKIGL